MRHAHHEHVAQPHAEVAAEHPKAAAASEGQSELLMPLTAKGKKVLAAMKKEYGATRGEQVFYASVNANKITGAEAKKKKK